jgi:hypothetical protein
MATTVIGIFDEFQPAFSAKNELLASSGLSWTQVQLVPDHDVPKREHEATPHTDPNSIAFNIGKLFTGLFGADQTQHSNVYADAVRRGGYVVTVDVNDEAKCATIEEIINRFGPLSVETRSGEWMQQGWRGHDPKAG